MAYDDTMGIRRAGIQAAAAATGLGVSFPPSRPYSRALLSSGELGVT